MGLDAACQVMSTQRLCQSSLNVYNYINKILSCMGVVSTNTTLYLLWYQCNDQQFLKKLEQSNLSMWPLNSGIKINSPKSTMVNISRTYGILLLSPKNVSVQNVPIPPLVYSRYVPESDTVLLTLSCCRLVTSNSYLISLLLFGFSIDFSATWILAYKF